MQNKYQAKFLTVILAFIILFSGSCLYHTFTMVDNPTESYVSEDMEETGKSSSDAKEIIVSDLANRLGLPVDNVDRFLRVNDNCRLVPLMASEEHKNCLIDIFSNSDKDYIKYYRDGQLMLPEKVEEIYYKEALCSLWEKPEISSITFIIDYDNKSVGRIGVGPIKNRNGVDCEIGYAIKQEYCGKHITASSAKAVLNLLQYMVDTKPEEYNLTRLRATVREDNVASSRILEKLGFKKSPEPVYCSFGERLEYLYSFIDA